MTEETRPAENGENEEQDQLRQDIVDLGSSTVKTKDGTIHTLTIVGTIEGHQEERSGAKTTKYEHVLPLLTAVEESDEADGLLILLNTMGGDIEAGLAIAEMISGMRKPTVSLVLGGGHSIGVPQLLHLEQHRWAHRRFGCSPGHAGHCRQSSLFQPNG